MRPASQAVTLLVAAVAAVTASTLVAGAANAAPTGAVAAIATDCGSQANAWVDEGLLGVGPSATYVGNGYDVRQGGRDPVTVTAELHSASLLGGQTATITYTHSGRSPQNETGTWTVNQQRREVDVEAGPWRVILGDPTCDAEGWVDQSYNGHFNPHVGSYSPVQEFNFPKPWSRS